MIFENLGSPRIGGNKSAALLACAEELESAGRRWEVVSKDPETARTFRRHVREAAAMKHSAVGPKMIDVDLETGDTP
jgi:hypothetical protein